MVKKSECATDTGRHERFIWSKSILHIQQHHSRHTALEARGCVCVPPNIILAPISTTCGPVIQYGVRRRRVAVDLPSACIMRALPEAAIPLRMSCNEPVEACGCSHKRATNPALQDKQCSRYAIDLTLCREQMTLDV